MTGSRRLQAWATAAALTLTLTPALALRASAQSPTPRVVLGVSGGIQAPAPAFSDRFEFESNVETATVAVEYPGGSAGVGDASVGVRVWKGLGAGVAVSSASRTGSADLDARLPHPLLFQRPRSLTASQSGIRSSELGVHTQLLYTLPVTARIALVLSGGPSVVRLTQDLVTGLTYDDTYPFDEVTFRNAPAQRAVASATGFNAGVDLRWMFTRSFGLGALVRYSRATVDLNADARTVRVRVGGAQAGVGVRVAF